MGQAIGRPSPIVLPPITLPSPSVSFFTVLPSHCGGRMLAFGLIDILPFPPLLTVSFKLMMFVFTFVMGVLRDHELVLQGEAGL